MSGMIISNLSDAEMYNWIDFHLWRMDEETRKRFIKIILEHPLVKAEIKTEEQNNE